MISTRFIKWATIAGFSIVVIVQLAITSSSVAAGSPTGTVTFEASVSGFDGIRAILNSPDGEIDIGLANLTLAQIYHRRLDIDHYLQKLDTMAAAVESRIRKRSDAKETIAVMNDYFFEDYGLTAVLAPYPRDFLLNELLDTKKGRCMALVALYMAVGDRIDVRVESLVAPGHIYARMSPPKRGLFSRKPNPINIETTEKGVSYPDAYYRAHITGGFHDDAKKFYLRPLTRKEMLATYLSALGDALRYQKRYDEAIEACKLSISINPNDIEAWNNLGSSYNGKGLAADAEAAFRKALELNSDFAGAWHNLGALQQDVDTKIAYYKKALELAPSQVEIWRELFWVYYDNEKYQLAWTCVMRARILADILPPDVLRRLKYKLRMAN